MEKRITKVDVPPTTHYVLRCSAYPYKYICFLSFLLLTLLIVAGCGREVIVPESLTGEWRTSAPGYDDRYIIFTTNRLIYGIGDGGETSHPIKKIDIEQLGHRTAYTFHYIDAEGDKTFLSFTYSSDAGGTIQLKNDKNDKIWKKAAP